MPSLSPPPSGVLLFFGSGRTGSTLVGQILNFHPCCLVANEHRFLDRLLKGQQIPEALDDLKMVALRQYHTGLEEDSHYKTTMSKSQTRWKAMGHLSKNPAFQKKEISLLGDKKAGQNSVLYQKEPEKVLALLGEIDSRLPIRLIQVLRDPLMSARSYMKSHGYASFEEACRRVAMDQAAAHSLLESKKGVFPSYRLYYEDLMEDPAREIERLCRWLDLDCPPDWKEEMAGLVGRETPALHSSFQELCCLRKVIGRKGAKEVFLRYQRKPLSFFTALFQ